MQNAVLKFENISKDFPGVKALDDVSIEVHGGEVTALIGVNGAGKSTLMNILGGIHHASSGKIFINGKEVKINSPHDAERYGIGFIHQEPTMFSYMTVAENIFISRLGKFVNYKKLNSEAKKYLDMLGSDIKPTAKVGDLPIGERQVVAIARALSCGGKILLFDEPTASFTSAEKERLFEIICQLKQQGAIIFFISHFLDEVEEISDKTIVIRDGKIAISGQTKDIPRSNILINMIGGEITKLENKERILDKVVFKAESITTGKAPNDVSFELREGEVLGLWGLMGSGRTELFQTLYGLVKADKGKVYMDTGDGLKPISFSKIRNYCGYVTEARHDDGVLLPWPIWKNITAPNLKSYRKKPFSFLDLKKQRDDASKYVEKLNVKTPNIDVKIESLSGGNQQKSIMAKWFLRKPQVFFLDEPTRGVDVGAKGEIHMMIQNLAMEGTACLLVSSEIEEIFALSDRVLVLNRGRIVAEVDKAEIDKELLMSYCV